MDTSQIEKVNALAKSLYGNRLAGSMDDAFQMAERILSRAAAGEERAVKEIVKDAPDLVELHSSGVRKDPLSIREDGPSSGGPRAAGSSAVGDSCCSGVSGSCSSGDEGVSSGGPSAVVSHDAVSHGMSGDVDPDPEPHHHSMDADDEADHHDPAHHGHPCHCSHDDGAGSDAHRIAALRRIVAEEEERIALLRAELASLKVSASGSASIRAGIDAEVSDLSKGIDAVNDDVAQIRDHIKDLEDIKQDIKAVGESQDESDEMASRAEDLKAAQGNEPQEFEK